MQKISSPHGMVKKTSARSSKAEEVMEFTGDPDTRLTLIQSLIPIALMAVSEEPQAEVQTLCWSRYARKGNRSKNRRWGSQQGSVYLADQKAPTRVPRVRDTQAGREVPLEAYQKLQQPARLAEPLFRRVLSGMAAKRYADSAALVPRAFGLFSSSVSEGSLWPRPGSWPRSRREIWSIWIW